MIKLGELEAGRRFHLPYSGKTGVVIRQGAMGTSIRYAGSQRHVKGQSKRTGQTFEFTATGPVEVISSSAEVEPLTGSGEGEE